jgi:chemotaxis protein methyltransferase CheR
MSTTARPTTRLAFRAPASPPPRPTTQQTGGVDDYVAFCEGVRNLASLDLLQYKRGQMERRIRTFTDRLGMSSLTDYLAMLQQDPQELERFLDRVTINVSQLWRNPEQWVALGNEIVPQLAASGRIRIWSAGCSYGAECYTIAAVCLEHAAHTKVEVKGTDIDPRMLERARAGVFSAQDVRTVPAASLARWFERTDAGWQANAELRNLVSFDHADLLAMAVPSQAYDLVLCRNVVIYFNEDVRDKLHQRLVSSLRGGGYLVVGSTERVSGSVEMGLTSSRPFIYRKS